MARPPFSIAYKRQALWTSGLPGSVPIRLLCQREGKTAAIQRSLDPVALPFARIADNSSRCPPTVASEGDTSRALLGRKGVFGMDSVQLRVLGFGLFQDGNVRIGVLPEGEKDLVSGERPDAGGVGVSAVRNSCL